MPKTPSPALEMTILLADNTRVVARRCGLLPDVFATESGELFQVQKLEKYVQSGHPVIKYHKNTLMARHLVGDAWLPGWEDEGSRLECLDGDTRNVAVNNLAINREPGRGRPRDSKVYRRLKAAALFRACPNPEVVGEEVDLPAREVLHAAKTYAPEAFAAYEVAGGKVVE